MTVKAFAKINLGLEIVRRRSDGYHDIRTLFQSISLADELALEPAPEGEILVEGDEPSVAWDGTNLVHRAAGILRDRTGTKKGVRIRVKKMIPPGKGLGGGSADAAATLLALDEMWGLDLTPEEMASMARSLGADVPFFLKGGLCLGEGIGDLLTLIPDFPPLPCLIVFPPFPISTAKIYGGLGPSLTSEGKPSKIMRFLESGDFGLLENGLEDVIFRSHPELEGLKMSLKDRGAMLSLVSGSGSAVYGLFASRDEAREALGELRGESEAVLAETLSREGYWAELGAGV
ncbi:MAG: 4-(cytidine 5'-diphospho)-2-C-methyl-D-erythritol kinase [Candidatus Aminicenantes bacterium]